jgi:hypothetical protein
LYQFQFKDRQELTEFLETELWTTVQVAEFLKITRQAVKSLLENGRIKPIFSSSTTSYYLKKEIQAKESELKSNRKKFRPYE